MSRTKRVYNYPNKIFHEWHRHLGRIPYWHPYKVIWSNKGRLDEPLMSKRRRMYHKIEIKRELHNLCPYTTLEDNCYNCLMRWDGNECKYMDEYPVHIFKQQYPGTWL